jgi:hypothetical protein
MAVLMAGQATRLGSLRLSTPVVLTGVVLGTILLIRLSGLTATTAFFDEALYALIGRNILLHIPDYPAIRWITGSYLYPLLSGQASLLFDSGLYGVRLISAVSTTLAALAAYLTAARLFNRTAALLALIVFGFTGISVFIGQFGTYDALGVGCLAGAVTGLVYGLTEGVPARQARYLVLGGVALALSILSKYVALLYLPVAGGLLLGLAATGRWRLARQFFQCFLLPVGVIFGLYVLIFRDDLWLMVTSVQTSTWQPATRLVILQEIIRDLRFPVLFALLGSVHLLLQGRLRRVPREVPAGSGWLVPLLWSAAAIFPAYHLLTANIRALDKHMAYSLVFLAPLAGWGLYQLFHQVQQRVHRPLAQTLLLSVWIAGLLFAVDKELDRAWVLNHNWPDKSATLDYLAGQSITAGTHILAEGGDTYTFHLNWQGRVDVVTTWSFYYKGRSGAAAMQQGITDHYFSYLLFDNFFTPEVSAPLKSAALANGYQRVFQHSDSISSGAQVNTEIYALPPPVGGPKAPPATP